MKKYFLLICFVFLLFSCEDDNNNFMSTLSFEAYLEPIITENGNLNTIWVDFSLYHADNIIFTEQQDLSKLKEYPFYAIDNEGNYHKAIKVLSPSSGNAHLYLEPGKYFIVLLVKETGKYSHSYIEIKCNELTNVRKIFTSKFPENTYEPW